MAMRPMLLRAFGPGFRSWSGSAALVGTHGVEYGHPGVDRSGDGSLADTGPKQVAQRVLVVHGRGGRVDELLDALDEAVRIVVEREVARSVEDLEDRAGHRGVRHQGVIDRDHRIS